MLRTLKSEGYKEEAWNERVSCFSDRGKANVLYELAGGGRQLFAGEVPAI